MADQVKMNDSELDEVSGGAGGWQKYAKGGFVNYGNYIVYTVASGDVLSGIALRFGVTVPRSSSGTASATPTSSASARS